MRRCLLPAFPRPRRQHDGPDDAHDSVQTLGSEEDGGLFSFGPSLNDLGLLRVVLGGCGLRDLGYSCALFHLILFVVHHSLTVAPLQGFFRFRAETLTLFTPIDASLESSESTKS